MPVHFPSFFKEVIGDLRDFIIESIQLIHMRTPFTLLCFIEIIAEKNRTFKVKVKITATAEGKGQASDTTPAPRTDSISAISLSSGLTRTSRPAEMRDSCRAGFWIRK